MEIEKCLHSGCVLKIEPTRFSDRLETECVRKKKKVKILLFWFEQLER